MRLFIRTEASPQIGMGHFMRCFAIAEEARGQGIPVTFLLNETFPAVRARADQIGAEVQVVTTAIGAEDDLSGIGFAPDDWLLIDSYKATSGYLSRMKARCRITFIDDLKAFDRYDCDLLINSAMAASGDDYAGKTRAPLLLGPAYALIRREFRETYPSATAPFVSLMFGGSDPVGLTLLTAQRLNEALPDLRLKIIAGPANSHVEALKTLSESHSGIELYVDPPSVAEVLTSSALVITAAGGSVGEIAAMGLPALALVVVDNQVAALEACPYPVMDARGGLPADLADRVRSLLDDPAGRARIATHAHSIVDGLGAQRIVEVLKASMTNV